MKTLGEILAEARKNAKLTLKNVSNEINIDPSLISKFEKNERKPTKSQITLLADFFKIPEIDLIISWHSDRIVEDLKYIESNEEILKVAEEKIKYLKSNSHE